MAGDFEVRITGLDDLRAALIELPANLRRRALRNALAAGARLIRDAAKRSAPVLAKPSRYRRAGTLQKAITVRTSKIARRAGDVGVFVNVRPAKGTARGAKSPTDPFYWRFVEFGTKRSRELPFLRPAAAAQSGAALSKIVATLGPAIQKLNVRRAKP